MTVWIMSVGGAVVLLGSLLLLALHQQGTRTRSGSAFGPETKGRADFREASRTAHTVHQVNLPVLRGRG